MNPRVCNGGCLAILMSVFDINVGKRLQAFTKALKNALFLWSIQRYRTVLYQDVSVHCIRTKRIMAKGLLTILIFVITTGQSFGQLTREDIDGDWETDNKDSLYYKSDTIEFIQDANWEYRRKTCDIVVLRVSKSDFKFINSYLCTEPGRERWTNGKQTIKIKKGKTGQTIEIKVLDKVETFKIIDYKEERVERYPWDIKKLKLKRV
jgi:hypothetical protein